MVSTAFGQLQETAADSSFSSDLGKCSRGAQTQKETLHNFLKGPPCLCLMPFGIFSIFRPQLLRCRMAKAMVCPEQRDFLLLRDGQRLVCDVSVAERCFMFAGYVGANSPCLSPPSSGRQTSEGFAVYQRLRCAAGKQPEKRLQEKFLLRAVCSGPPLFPGLHTNLSLLIVKHLLLMWWNICGIICLYLIAI